MNCGGTVSGGGKDGEDGLMMGAGLAIDVEDGGGTFSEVPMWPIYSGCLVHSRLLLPGKLSE